MNINKIFLSLAITLSLTAASTLNLATISQSSPAPVTVDSSSNRQIEEAVVNHLLSDGFKQSVQPQVPYAVLADKYAIAEWRWKYMGGEALLQKERDTWLVLESSGGAYNSMDLVERGIPEDTAKALVQALEVHWSKRTTSQ